MYIYVYTRIVCEGESPESEAKQIRKMASLLVARAQKEGGGFEGFCCSFFGHDQLRHHTGRHHPFLEYDKTRGSFCPV